MGELKKAQKLTVELMEERGLNAIANVRISHIEAQTITLADGRLWLVNLLVKYGAWEQPMVWLED